MMAVQNAGRPGKHSLTLGGHRTSVSLEPAFWQALQQSAQRCNIGVNELASRIDRERGAKLTLASAIRLYLFAQSADVKK